MSGILPRRNKQRSSGGFTDHRGWAPVIPAPRARQTQVLGPFVCWATNLFRAHKADGNQKAGLARRFWPVGSTNCANELVTFNRKAPDGCGHLKCFPRCPTSNMLGFFFCTRPQAADVFARAGFFTETPRGNVRAQTHWGGVPGLETKLACAS